MFELHENTSPRAAFFANEFASALSEVETLYRENEWRDARPSLVLVLKEMEKLLLPYKNQLLTLQARRLGLKLHLAAYEVTLVPITYQRTGGYSHPTVIVSPNSMSRLVESSYTNLLM